MLGKLHGHVATRLETKKSGLTKIFLLFHVMSENFVSVLVCVSFVCDKYCDCDVGLSAAIFIRGG